MLSPIKVTVITNNCFIMRGYVGDDWKVYPNDKKFLPSAVVFINMTIFSQGPLKFLIAHPCKNFCTHIIYVCVYIYTHTFTHAFQIYIYISTYIYLISETYYCTNICFKTENLEFWSCNIKLHKNRTNIFSHTPVDCFAYHWIPLAFCLQRVRDSIEEICHIFHSKSRVHSSWGS